MIPIATDRPLKHKPYVNKTLVFINVLVWMGTVVFPEFSEFAMMHLYLYGKDSLRLLDGSLIQVEPHWWQYITYQFLHADLWHVAGNMLFLWVFGNLVEDRFGKIGYLAFYLVGGVIAGLGHTLTSDAPVLGASGSVAAVTGVFLALFPRTRIKVLWLILLITVFEIPSMWFIGFAICKDLIFQLFGRGSNVAYVAHLAGNFFGLSVGIFLLWRRIIPRESYDAFSLIRHWNRRREFRVVTRQQDPWKGTKRTHPAEDKNSNDEQQSHKSKTKTSTSREFIDYSKPKKKRVEGNPDRSINSELLQYREQIREALRAGNQDEAIMSYLQLIKQDPEVVLSQSVQLEIANRLFQINDHANAALAYRTFLTSYPNEDPQGQVHLMLGVTLARYLDEKDEATHVLEAAIKKLPSGQDRTLAKKIYEELTTEGDAT